MAPDTRALDVGALGTGPRPRPPLGALRPRGVTRLLIYSHDSFGLGHLRRCRSIAQNLVQTYPDLEVLILSGLPIIASYAFDERVRYRLVPGIIKLSNGDYKALDAADIREAIDARSRLILETAQEFQPDLFLIDKEPLGIRGEVTDTLVYLKERGVPVVLGVRDVMDDPVAFAAEWERKLAVPALEDYFSEIWVYGMERIYRPLEGLPLPAAVEQKIVYTSYLWREENRAPSAEPLPVDPPFLLVTPGGGGDGEGLVDWVLSAYERATDLLRALIVCGPFMHAESRRRIEARAARLRHVEVLTFAPDMERLMTAATAVVAMGGYNTFCEILSFDKPSLIVPRTRPRLEQFIRAREAERQGLLRMLPHDEDNPDPQQMIDALKALPSQPRPSSVVIPGLLDGHSAIAHRFAALTGLAADAPIRAASA
ncbi:membrane protein [Elstera cyanobacteriorum]|uniref:Glycosyl transferase family 28 C-terminal domain-containing protein n=1 Tax=Elstera cyanobacteriorum TaxID=2022747 RepID=A0A255XI40_9PROT|nr:glycosyltransferase [Elstera cyanobacteriorum]OYQ16608.1 hypothetical protein CHR90_16575 [Elstera cyanobacteriorum]GFZ87219.1 membrane protein [Elstera cyanobacteriorum]